MDDDLNVPQALAVVHETVRAGNTALDGKDRVGVERALHQVLAMTDVLYINPLDPHWNTGGTDIAARQALDILVKAQLEERRDAREAKDWTRADAIRDTLAAAGVVVEDSADGPTWTVAAR
jgi:cysteinyl-tRNA synthetase